MFDSDLTLWKYHRCMPVEVLQPVDSCSSINDVQVSLKWDVVSLVCLFCQPKIVLGLRVLDKEKHLWIGAITLKSLVINTLKLKCIWIWKNVTLYINMNGPHACQAGAMWAVSPAQTQNIYWTGVPSCVLKCSLKLLHWQWII